MNAKSPAPLLVSANELGYCYPGGTEALRGISFSLVHGESLGIVGPNGAGKSTLLQHFTGTLLAARGSLAIGGIMVAKANLTAIRRRVGMVFQNPDDQLFMPTVFEDVAFGPRNSGLRESEVNERVNHALRALRIENLGERMPHSLSDGEKRAAAIAGVMAMQPELLVLDEPTANLDPRNRRSLIAFLNAQSAAKIVVSHDLDFVWETCPRTVLLAQGRIVADGPTRDLLSDRNLLEKHGLELPLRLQGPV